MAVQEISTELELNAYRPIHRVAMPVVHSNPLAPPGAGDAGGMTVYVRQIARGLAARGIEVDIFTRRDSPDAPEVASLGPGVRAIQVPSGDPRLAKEDLPAVLPAFTCNLLKWVEDAGVSYEIIHSHYWLSGRVAAFLKDRWNQPFVHTFHTLGKVKNGARRPGDEMEPDSRLSGEGRVISEACAIVASTHEERRSLIELYSAHPEKIRLIPPGVDHDLFKPREKAEAKRRLGLEGKRVLLFVGRLQPLKAADTAVRVLAHLIHSGRIGLDEARLLIVGGSSGALGAGEPTRLKELAAGLGVSAAISFVDARPQELLPDYYCAADVCLVPSHTESFGLVALEAQASGVPVVGSAVGGLKSIVRNGYTGYLVEPGSSVAFAEKAWRILSDATLASNMSRLAVCASNEFSWDQSAAELHDLYASSRLMQECGATA